MATTTVTPEQIDACTRVIDQAKHEVFYLVQSATDVTVTYQVRFNRQYKRLSCQCKGNQQGYVCWHIRAAYEAAKQYAEVKRAECEAKVRMEQERLETWTRVMQAVPTCYSEYEVQRDLALNADREFKLMR